ncbi:hypothetical protein HZF05_02565 [Sphingomonas sp. CGMCC 1.13654]|uniref:PDZ domain-containing protein n=1 Tax=Sphingomonas chungangi TaxID=2683589 RepID=A0A838L0W1_9SPHN|nr:hypothetical protein [Sphingomonas chungangi]MBA2932971.1 hypothetical protein [Sphingomonas chungangi]MVW56591.1 hypothetical protein [Sphingomonas chungangi]
MKLPDHLPPLSGWSFQVYRVLWVVLLIPAIASVMLSYRAQVRYEAASRADYAAGIWLDRSTAGGAPITPISDEAHAKVRKGDVLIAVAGKPVPSNEMQWADMLAGLDGAPLDLLIRHVDGSRSAITLRRDSHLIDRVYARSGMSYSARVWLAWGTSTAANLLTLATSLLLFLRRPRDPVAALVAISGLLICVDPGTLSADPPLILFYLPQAVINIALTAAMAAFPAGNIRSRLTRMVIAAALLSGGCEMLKYWPGGAIVSVLFEVTTASTILLLGIAVILNFRALAAGLQRQQMKFALLGFIGACLFTLLGALLDDLASFYMDAPLRPWLSLSSDIFGNFAGCCFAGGLLVSLLRYRLYDADALISRSAAYAALTLMLGAAFAACEQVIEVFGERYFGDGGQATAAGLAAAAAAVLIAPAHNRVHRWTEQRFQRALAKFRRDLPETVNDMREFASLDQLLATVASQLEQGVRASRAAILLGEGDEPLRIALTRHMQTGEMETWLQGWAPSHNDNLQCEREDAMFPLRLRLHATGAATIGWVLLGPRPDGSFFGKDEREALAGVADPVARAIHIVRQRDAREIRLTGRIGVLEGEVARLVRLLKPVGAASPA